MRTCENCVYFDAVDETVFWCDIHGACTMDNLEPCSRFKDGGEEDGE